MTIFSPYCHRLADDEVVAGVMNDCTLDDVGWWVTMIAEDELLSVESR